MDSNHTCLAIFGLDFALKEDENYYPQVLLKVSKYIEKKVIKHTNDNLSDLSSDDSDDSDEEYSFCFNELVETFLLCKFLFYTTSSLFFTTL